MPCVVLLMCVRASLVDVGAFFWKRAKTERGSVWMFCLLLIHRFAVPLSRCGSVTLGLFYSAGVKFISLVTLRYL